MPGGIVQILYKGNNQNILNKNPEITFFKYKFCKPHNFALEDRFIEPENEVLFNNYTNYDVKLYGDLFYNPVLRIELPEIYSVYNKTKEQYLNDFNNSNIVKNTNTNLLLSKLDSIIYNFEKKKLPFFINKDLIVNFNYENSTNKSENFHIKLYENQDKKYSEILDKYSNNKDKIKYFSGKNIPEINENQIKDIYYTSYNINYLTDILTKVNFSDDILLSSDDFFEMFKENLYNFVAKDDETKFLYSVQKNKETSNITLSSKNIISTNITEIEYKMEYFYNNMNLLYIYGENKVFKTMFFVSSFSYSGGFFSNKVRQFINLENYLIQNINSENVDTYYIASGFRNNKSFNITKVNTITYNDTSLEYDISTNIGELDIDNNYIYMLFSDNFPKDQDIDSNNDLVNLDIEDYYDIFYKDIIDYNKDIYNEKNLLLPICFMEYVSFSEETDSYKFKLYTLDSNISNKDYLYIYKDIIIFDEQSQKDNFLLINDKFYEIDEENKNTSHEYNDKIHIDSNYTDVINQSITRNGDLEYLLNYSNNNLVFINKNDDSKTYNCQEYISPYRILKTIDSNIFDNSRLKPLVLTKKIEFNLDSFNNLNYNLENIKNKNLLETEKTSILLKNISTTIQDNILYVKNLIESYFNDAIYFKYWNVFQFSNTTSFLNLNQKPDFVTNYSNFIYTNGKINKSNNYFNYFQEIINKETNDFINNLDVLFVDVIRYIYNLRDVDYSNVSKDTRLVNLLNNTKNLKSHMMLINTNISTIFYHEDTSETTNAILKSKIYFRFNENYAHKDEYTEISNGTEYYLDYDSDNDYYYISNLFFENIDNSNGTSSIIYLTPYNYETMKKFFVFMHMFFLPRDENLNYSINEIFLIPNNLNITDVNPSSYSFNVNRTVLNMFFMYDSVNQTSNLAHFYDSEFENTIINRNTSLDLHHLLYHYSYYMFIDIKDRFYYNDVFSSNNFIRFNSAKMYETMWHIRQIIDKKQKNGNISSLQDLNAESGGSNYYFDCNICFSNFIDVEMINNSLINNIDDYLTQYVSKEISSLLDDKTSYFNYFDISYNFKFYTEHISNSTDININNQTFIKTFQWYLNYLNSIKSDIEEYVINYGGLEIFNSLKLSKFIELDNFFNVSSNIFDSNDNYLGSNLSLTIEDYNKIININQRFNDVVDFIYSLLEGRQMIDSGGSINIYTKTSISTIFNNILFSDLEITEFLYSLIKDHFTNFYNDYEYKEILDFFVKVKNKYVDFYEILLEKCLTNGSSIFNYTSELLQFLNFHNQDYKDRMKWLNKNINFEPSEDVLLFKTNTNIFISHEDFYKLTIINNPVIEKSDSRIRKHYNYILSDQVKKETVFNDNFYLLQILYNTVDNLVYNFNTFFGTSNSYYSDYRVIYPFYFYIYEDYQDDNNTFKCSFHSSDNTSNFNILTDISNNITYNYSKVSFSQDNNINYILQNNRLFDISNGEIINYEYNYSLDPISYSVTEEIKTYDENHTFIIRNNKIYNLTNEITYKIQSNNIYDLNDNLVGSYHETKYTLNSIDYKYLINSKKQQLLHANYKNVSIFNNTVNIKGVLLDIVKNIYYNSQNVIKYTFSIPSININAFFPYFRLLDENGVFYEMKPVKIRPLLLQNDTNTNIFSIFTKTFDNSFNFKTLRYLQSIIGLGFLEIVDNQLVINRNLTKNLINNILNNSIFPIHERTKDTVICESFNNIIKSTNNLDFQEINDYIKNFNPNNNSVKILNETDQELSDITEFETLNKMGKNIKFIPDRYVYRPIGKDLIIKKEETNEENFNYCYTSSFTTMKRFTNKLKENTSYDFILDLNTKEEMVKDYILDKMISDSSNNVLDSFYHPGVYFDISGNDISHNNIIGLMNDNSYILRNRVLLSYNEFLNMNCLNNDEYTLIYNNDFKYYLQNNNLDLFLITFVETELEDPDLSYNDCTFKFYNSSKVYVNVSNSIFSKTLYIFEGIIFRYNNCLDMGFKLDENFNIIRSFEYDLSTNVISNIISNNQIDSNTLDVKKIDSYLDVSNNYLNVYIDRITWNDLDSIEDNNDCIYFDSSINIKSGDYYFIKDYSSNVITPCYVLHSLYIKDMDIYLIKVKFLTSNIVLNLENYILDNNIKTCFDYYSYSKIDRKIVFYYWETFYVSYLKITKLLTNINERIFRNQKFALSNYPNKIFDYLTSIKHTDEMKFLMELPNDVFKENVDYNINDFKTYNSIRSIENNIEKNYKIFKDNVRIISQVLKRPEVPECAWMNNIGNFICNTVQLNIGNETFEEIDNNIINIYNSRKIKNDGKDICFNKMIGNIPELTKMQKLVNKNFIYVPIPLCCEKSEKALPLIAMLNSKVQIKVLLNSLDKITIKTDSSIVKNKGRIKMQLMGTYVFLDDTTRKLFALSRHEYLFTVKKSFINLSSKKNDFIDITIKQPIKEFMFMINTRDNEKNGRLYNYTNDNNYDYYTSKDAVIHNNLLLNNETREFVKKILDKKEKLINKGRNSNLVNLTDPINVNALESKDYDKISNFLKEKLISYNDSVINARLFYDGKDRFIRDGDFSSLVTNYSRYKSSLLRGVNSYTFSLKPLEEASIGSNNLANSEGTRFYYTLREDNDCNTILVVCYYKLVRIASGFAVSMW